MRLFLAIDIPEEIKTYLRELQQKLPKEKLVGTRDFHLTLKFLGSCDPSRQKRIEALLKNFPLIERFDATLHTLGIFGSQRFPRVIWVGLHVPPWLTPFQNEIEKQMEKIGFPMEHRFSPHITLARVKFVSDPDGFSEAIGSIKVSPKSFPVQHYYLFESHLSAKGATYEKLAEF